MCKVIYDIQIRQVYNGPRVVVSIAAINSFCQSINILLRIFFRQNTFLRKKYLGTKILIRQNLHKIFSQRIFWSENHLSEIISFDQK